MPTSQYPASFPGEYQQETDIRQPTLAYFRPIESYTPPVSPLHANQPHPSLPPPSHLGQENIPPLPNFSWVSIHDPPVISITPSSNRESLTASPVSTVRPGLADTDDRTEYMSLDPYSDFGALPANLVQPTVPPAIDEDSIKRGFVGGFVRRLKSLPRAILRTYTGSGGPNDRHMTKKGTGDTAGSLPKYTETANNIASIGDIPDEVGPWRQFTQRAGMSTIKSETIPEEDERGQQDTQSFHQNQHSEFFRSHIPNRQPARPLPTPLSPASSSTHPPTMPPVSSHHPMHPIQEPSSQPVSNLVSQNIATSNLEELGGEAITSRQEIHTSTVADMSPETVFPSPASDYDHMEYTIRTPSEASFGTYISRIVQIFHNIYDLPWISTTRVVKDYIPEVGKMKKGYRKPVRLKHSWYARVEKSHSTLDLLADPRPAIKRRRASSTLMSPSSQFRNTHTTELYSSRRASSTHAHTRPVTRRPRAGPQRSSGTSRSSASHSYLRQHSATSPRYPSGHAQNPPYHYMPQPMIVSGVLPQSWGPAVPGGTTGSLGAPPSSQVQATALPLYLLAASPSGAPTGLPLQHSPVFNVNPTGSPTVLVQATAPINNGNDAVNGPRS
jgi:hypothetical protein